jgi:hypothetical protein
MDRGRGVYLKRLQWMRRCQEHADKTHDDDEVRAAARVLGAEDHLPDPEQLELLQAE